MIDLDKLERRVCNYILSSDFEESLLAAIMELKAARELIKQVEGALSFNSEDGYNIGKAMDKYCEAGRG